MVSNLRYAFRRLLRTPGFTIAAVATLAICIGANLTIFAVVDAIIVRSLPFPAADRLVHVYNSYPIAGLDRSLASTPNYFDRRKAIKAFASLSIIQEANVIIGGPDSANRVPIALISPEFFTTLGVPLALGRPFSEAELAQGADRVAILTDEFWHSHFNADPNVIGSTFLNDGLPITVVGLLPPSFHFPSSRAQFYRPAAIPPDDRDPKRRHSNQWIMVARIAPGSTLAEAQAQINAFNARQATDDPHAAFAKSSGYHTVVAPLRADYVRRVKPMLVLLQCGVLFLLLIGAVNLANLILIRTSGRAKELAVRQALGAGRHHMVLDVLIETGLLACIGGLGGIFLGTAGINFLRVLGTDKLPLGTTIAFNGRVAAAALVIGVAAALLLAIPALWLNLHARLASSLQGEFLGNSASRGVQRLRHGFVVIQVALAFVLLSGAGLLGVSLKRALETPTGFNPDHIVAGDISLPSTNYKNTAARVAFVERLLPAIRGLPGVTQVAAETQLPFTGKDQHGIVAVEGVTPKAGTSIRTHYLSAATSDYWSVMGIKLLRGRLLEDADNHRQPKVCVVDEAFAERYWPGGNPIGRRISHFSDTFNKANALTIVGVVANVKQNDLAEDAGYGAEYESFGTFDPSAFTLVVRTPLAAGTIAPMIQKAIFQLDPELPIDNVRPLQALIADSLVARRSPAILARIFAGVALLLATVGTYGALSYAVALRQREIGIRIALGAIPAQIRNQFLSLGLRLLVTGSLVGVLGAWWTGRATQSVLFTVPGMQGSMLMATLAVIGAVVLSACLLPAHRAAKVDPMTALRAE
jgi:predicted permease